MLKHIDKLDSLRLKKGHGIYERTETTLIGSILKEGQVFVDVGAHIGYYTILAAKIVGEKGAVYSFEPEPDNFKVLNRNIVDDNLTQCHAYQATLSGRSGISRLYLSKVNSGDHQSFYTPDRESVDVIAITLDRSMSRINKEINFIKIDVQGWECSVLRGAYRTLKHPSNVKLLIEYYASGLKMAGSSGSELLTLLRMFGFTICVKEKSGWHPKSDDEIRSIYPRKHTNLYCYKESA